MGSLNDAEATADMRRRAATLNALPAADYAGALRLKLDYARRLYEMEGEATRATAEYRDFVSRNSTWLLPIRRLLHPARPAPHARLPPVGRIRTVSPHTHKAPRKNNTSGKSACTTSCSIISTKQLRHVRDYCHLKGICLKGRHTYRDITHERRRMAMAPGSSISTPRPGHRPTPLPAWVRTGASPPTTGRR